MTPLIKFDTVYLKSEIANPTGSAKDRALSLQVSHLHALGYQQAVISSTGNAAISAQYYCQKLAINLKIFVSPHTNHQKLSQLKNFQISNKPISDAFRYAKKNQAYFLRQSTDPIALIGYQHLGSEILSQLPQITSIFIPVGSGTTLLGISQALPTNVKIFAVQPANFNPISSHFDRNFTPEQTSPTDALGVKLLPLKSKIINIIKQSNGSGLVIQSQQIIQAQKLLHQQQILSSAEGALALAAVTKAKQHFQIGDYPLVLLTGIQR